MNKNICKKCKNKISMIYSVNDQNSIDSISIKCYDEVSNIICNYRTYNQDIIEKVNNYIISNNVSNVLDLPNDILKEFIIDKSCICYPEYLLQELN
jgi:hypothetical protein